MQTFLPYKSFVESAKVLDNKRLGKQRVEAYQILKTLLHGPIIRTCKCSLGTAINFKTKRIICPRCNKQQNRTPWYNHPAVQMWKGYEFQLITYGQSMCREWIARGYKDTLLKKFVDVLKDEKPDINPPWLGNIEFHASHRSNLLRKDPKHYGRFGWIEPDNLPYF